MRKFEEIIVSYLPDDIIAYSEYKGKPYFSIRYEENGEHHVGYGTYNPQVLSNYIKDYFINVEEKLEKIKAEIEQCYYNDSPSIDGVIIMKEDINNIFNKHISELKGESNE